MLRRLVCYIYFFFFNDTATTEIYTLSLHDALPIFARLVGAAQRHPGHEGRDRDAEAADPGVQGPDRPLGRSGVRQATGQGAVRLGHPRRGRLPRDRQRRPSQGRRADPRRAADGDEPDRVVRQAVGERQGVRQDAQGARAHDRSGQGAEEEVSVSQADLDAVAEQLGRTPRGILEVVSRCPSGHPNVVKTEPRLDDGTPFPTMFYLTCDRLAGEIGTLEASGLMKEMTAKILQDPELARAYRLAHEAYLAEREAIAHVPEID